MVPTRVREQVSTQWGLTLIELMVVVAVLAILATIAIPSYNEYVNRMRRSDGKALLTAVALAQERHLSVYGVYTATVVGNLQDKAGLPSELAKDAGSGKYYSEKQYFIWSIDTAKDVDGNACTGCFTLTAERNDATSNDPNCKTMKLDSRGKKNEAADSGKEIKCRWTDS
jgi:type IV pilus assembly protein PilE